MKRRGCDEREDRRSGEPQTCRPERLQLAGGHDDKNEVRSAEKHDRGERREDASIGTRALVSRSAQATEDRRPAEAPKGPTSSSSSRPLLHPAARTKGSIGSLLTSCSRGDDIRGHWTTPDDTEQHVEARSVRGASNLRIRWPRGRGSWGLPSLIFLRLDDRQSSSVARG